MSLQKGFSNVLFENLSAFSHQLSFFKYSLLLVKNNKPSKHHKKKLFELAEIFHYYCIEKEEGVNSERNKRENLFMEIKAC